MADLPKPEDVGLAILDIIKAMNVRAGEIAPLMAVQLKLDPRYQADDINAGFDYLLNAGLIEPARSGFVRLTEAGYGPEPGSAEIERALLDAIGEYGIRAGQVLPMKGIGPKLMQRGYRTSEIAASINRLVSDGLIEEQGQSLFLTDQGYDAI